MGFDEAKIRNMPFAILLFYIFKCHRIPAEINHSSSNIFENGSDAYIIIKNQLAIIITWIKLINISNFGRVFQMVQKISLKIRYTSPLSILAYILCNIKKIFYQILFTTYLSKGKLLLLGCINFNSLYSYC